MGVANLQSIPPPNRGVEMGDCYYAQASPLGAVSTEPVESSEVETKTRETQRAINREIQKILVGLLREKDPIRLEQKYKTVLAQIKGFEKQAVPELLNAFRHQNETTRFMALRILKDAELAQIEEVFKALIDVFKQETTELLLVTLSNTLGRTGEKGLKVIPLLMKLLQRTPGEVTKAAGINLASLASDNGDGVESYVIHKLIDNFMSPDQNLRYNSAFALGQFGPKATIAIPALKLEVKKSNRAAIWALGKMGSKALSASNTLEKVANSKSPNTFEAVIALVRIDPSSYGAKAVPFFIRALTAVESDETAKETIDGEASLFELEKLGSLAAQELKNVLSKTPSYSFSHSERPNIRIFVVQMLGRMGAEAKVAVEELIAMVEGFDETERQAASPVLVRIGAPAAPKLIQAFSRTYRRPQFISILIQIGWPAIPYLITALDDKDENIRDGAIQALQDFGPEAAPAMDKLIKLLFEIDKLYYYYGRETTISSILNILAQIGPVSITKLLEANAFDVRLVTLVSKIGSEAIPILTSALTTGDVERRAKVAALFGALGTHGAEAVPLLFNLLKDPYEDCLVRGAVAQSLGAMGSEAAPAIPDLTRMAEQDPDPKCQKSAQSALHQLERAIK